MTQTETKASVIALLLNMMDVAREQEKTVDAGKFQKKLGIPVVHFSATDVKHYDQFLPRWIRFFKNGPR